MLVMSLSFLEKVPEEYQCIYEGSSEPVSCKPADFCDDPTVLSYSPNMDLSDSYDNWVTKYDLTCASKTKIGMIGSVGFISWIVTLLFLPRLSDVNGRAKFITYGYTVQTVFYGLLLWAPTYTWLIMCLAALGMLWTIRAQIYFTYIFENLSRRNFNLACLCMSLLEGFSGLLIVFYFTKITKYWGYLFVAGFVMQLIGMGMSWFIKESPIYLAKSGQISQAKEVLT